MHREPEGGFAGLRDTMAYMARDNDIIAFFQFDDLAAGEFQRRAAAQDNHLFIFFLIVPKARRAFVRMRDDALDPDRRISPQASNSFAG